jgi:hypothetical protein
MVAIHQTSYEGGDTGTLLVNLSAFSIGNTLKIKDTNMRVVI